MVRNRRRGGPPTLDSRGAGPPGDGTPEARTKARSPRPLFAVMGAVGVVILLSGLLLGNSSPRRYVEATYDRSPADDIGQDAIAYTSPLPPTRVADAVTGQWRPGRGCADAEGVYLRYAEDTVVVLRRPQGSLILIEKADTAYPRYLAHVSGHWDR